MAGKGLRGIPAASLVSRRGGGFGSDATDLSLLVRYLGSHSTLSDQDRSAILGLPFSLRTVEPSTYLVREGEKSTACAVLLSGFAYRQKLTGEGARQIVAIHIPGEAVDFQNIFLDAADH